MSTHAHGPAVALEDLPGAAPDPTPGPTFAVGLMGILVTIVVSLFVTVLYHWSAQQEIQHKVLLRGNPELEALRARQHQDLDEPRWETSLTLTGRGPVDTLCLEPEGVQARIYSLRVKFSDGESTFPVRDKVAPGGRTATIALGQGRTLEKAWLVTTGAGLAKGVKLLGATGQQPLAELGHLDGQPKLAAIPVERAMSFVQAERQAGR